MNPADAARLELARRAFRATQPGESEVQRGVRRARLAVRRARPRRTWFSKTLVVVVLAMGGLAYAKPHALGEAVTGVLHGLWAGGEGDGAGGVAVASARPDPQRPEPSSKRQVGTKGSGALSGAARSAPVPPAPEEQERAARESSAPRPVPGERSEVRAVPARTVPVARGVTRAGSARADAESTATRSTSPWGRVGDALARGDEQGALRELRMLGSSGDARTRDKADLGRAQLLMAHGKRDQACALARTLMHRRAGGRIERQALVLLEECER